MHPGKTLLRVLIPMFLVLYACSGKESALDIGEAPTDPLGETAVDPLIQILIDRGVDPERIYDDGDSFVVDGDIVFQKSTLRREGLNLAQRKITGGLVSQSNVTNMTVNLTAVTLDDWDDAGRDAIDAWNDDIPHSKVHFSPSTSSSADIKVIFGSVTNGSASGDTPSGGTPGGTIKIDLDDFDNPSLSLQTRTIAHELGHTFGLCHTNNTNCGSASETHISGSPTIAEGDALSIMNSGTASFTGFTEWDRESARILYGIKNKVSFNVSIQYVNGNPKLTWTGAPKINEDDADEIHVILWRDVETEYGTFATEELVAVLAADNDGGGSYTDTSETFTGQQTCAEEYEITSVTIGGEEVGESNNVNALIGDGGSCD